MKVLRHPLLAIVLFFACTKTHAQYVTLPDTNFINFLRISFPACINGNQIDTTCPGIINTTFLDCSGKSLRDLTGIQYFDKLYRLHCYGNSITTLSILPETVQWIECYSNQLDSLPPLPPHLFSLLCGDNRLTHLPALPDSLVNLNCDNNLIDSLPMLNQYLEGLYCSNNRITSLPTLPPKLEVLYCFKNQIATLPTLGDSITQLLCSQNILTTLPVLPSALKYLYCNNNQLSSLPVLPANLISVLCYNNNITNIPNLPPSLTTLNCQDNKILSLPAFPPLLGTVNCSRNPQLTNLTSLAANMVELNCTTCVNLHCFPPLTTIQRLFIDTSAVHCLPNYGSIGYSFPRIDSIPLCDIFNTNACPVYSNISGRVYHDSSANCIQQTGEKNLPLIKVNLLQSGNIIQQQYTSQAGMYAFNSGTGDFTLTIDTTGLPLSVFCPSSGRDSVTIANIDSTVFERNFAMRCRQQAFDAGLQSIFASRMPRPGALVTLEIKTGNATSIWNQICDMDSASGQLLVTISGPAIYSSPAVGALTPLVAGNTLTYTVNNWSTLPNNAFNFQIKTDTTAQAGQLICVDAFIVSVNDFDTTNNHLSQCFTVVNSYDPNDKQVSPSGAISPAAQWLTYTIRFQNTGTAPAEHIYVVDTLDAAFDPSTFQLLAYSHAPEVQIYNTEHRARFNFPNINLPDSLHNEPESHGYVQYRVKTLSGLNCGTALGNPAYIYFDFNASVVTNAALTEIYSSTITSLQSTICHGEQFDFYGRQLNTSGSYTDTLPALFLCDSIITLQLEVLPAITESLNAAICPGETYVLGSHTFNSPGIYSDTAQTNSGCDSVVTLNLQISDTYSITIDTSILEGNSVMLPSGAMVTLPGTYLDTLQTVLGCDSIITTNLSVISGIYSPYPGLTNNNMQVYPNPTANQAVVAISESLSGGMLTLCDIMGRLLATTAVTTLQNELNTEELKNGVYILTATKGKQQVVKRLVISK